MLTQTGTYALQAALHLAHRADGRAISAAAMAAELELPRTYLAKVLHRLSREGVVVSARGPKGGYRLATDPTRVTVASVVAPFQELRPARTCLLGGPCAALAFTWPAVFHHHLDRPAPIDIGARVERIVQHIA